MPTLDARAEQHLQAYAAEVMQVLGDDAVGVVLYGSAAGVDWVAGRSDLNTVIVVRRVEVGALDALAPVLARWRQHGFALPVLLDLAQVAQACRLFPMELDDMRRQHRLLAGRDPFAGLDTDEAALRRECAQEAFGKLLRLRVLRRARRPPGGSVDDDDRLGEELRHRHPSSPAPARRRGARRLRGRGRRRRGDRRPTAGHAAGVARRAGGGAAALGEAAAAYLAEIERLVAAVVADCA
ncbi:MAG: hypothetical protein U0802_21780 [Candidatus Binatia bacterium]